MTSGDAGGIYERWENNRGFGGSAPLVNASRRPGEWQSYHIWFRAPRCASMVNSAEKLLGGEVTTTTQK